MGSNPTGGHGRLSVVSVVCCQVEVSADEMISRPEESYRLCCVVVCDLENLKNEEAMTRVGSQRHKKNLMGPPSYIHFVVDRNVVMPRIPIYIYIYLTPYILYMNYSCYQIALQ